MRIRPALGVVVLFSLFSAVAFAQTVNFGKTFTCNGERMSVNSCFNDADDANCGVYYPDRPLHNGIMLPEIEKRGDVIKKIKSCVGAGATLASTGNPAPSAAPAAGRAPAAAAAPAKPAGPPPPPDPSVAKARAAGADMTVLGVPLGQALSSSLPACQRQPGFFGIGTMLVQGQKYPCADSDSDELANGKTIVGISLETAIIFSQDECPAWIANQCVAFGMVRNGLLLAIYIQTSGQSGDATATQQLIAKYGKPTAQKAVTFKNLYNYSAQFQQMNWDVPGLHVEYNPFTTNLNTGAVVIETETGHQIRSAGQQAQQASQPKL